MREYLYRTGSLWDKQPLDKMIPRTPMAVLFICDAYYVFDRHREIKYVGTRSSMNRRTDADKRNMYRYALYITTGIRVVQVTSFRSCGRNVPSYAARVT